MCFMEAFEHYRASKASAWRAETTNRNRNERERMRAPFAAGALFLAGLAHALLPGGALIQGRLCRVRIGRETARMHICIGRIAFRACDRFLPACRILAAVACALDVNFRVLCFDAAPSVRVICTREALELAARHLASGRQALGRANRQAGKRNRK